MSHPISQRIKPIAIVLPQFHPIPENNEWWGEGFTEWTNVVKGFPRFSGHYQPHLPKHLGYYDMRLPETRAAQAAMARAHGVYGFCYYHYWFNGRRILERPAHDILQSSEPDFPFMLAWANENWTRNWDGGFNKVLLEQRYEISDFIAHARALIPYFKDPRYIRIDDRPVFAIYKDESIPAIKECISAFRQELKEHGIDVYLCRFERRVGTNPDRSQAYNIFDAGIEFQPLTTQFDKLVNRAETIGSKLLDPKRYSRRLQRLAGRDLKPVDTVVDYSQVAENDLAHDFQDGYPIFPGTTPGWDNSARRRDQSALILDGSTPEIFESWVQRKIMRTNWRLLPESLLFVNAWNEWAEGNHLEPCERWGTKYLEALDRASKALVTTSSSTSVESRLARGKE